jgi:ribosomal 30S subunit maturation factor RimM
VLIPFTDAICQRVDVAAKLIVIAPPEGLLELNAG